MQNTPRRKQIMGMMGEYRNHRPAFVGCANQCTVNQMALVRAHRG